MTLADNFCPNCGASNTPDAKNCHNCSQSLLTTSSQSQNNETGQLAPNYLLKQRYQIQTQLGQGGFGAVYQAADTQLGDRLVAIKEMSQFSLRASERAQAIDAFRQEAILLAGLTHPNLPRVYEQFEELTRWYLVMDFIEGETLEDRLSKQGPLALSLLETLQLGKQLAGVLQYLHSRQPPIIFRDLKPGNIMLTGSNHPYLIDFGIARHFKPGQIKDTIAFGSPGYAAPEQYGKAQTAPSADIFSLGATLHQLLTGDDPSENPFTFSPLETGNDSAREALNTLLLQMLNLNRVLRPASMLQVRQELERIIELTKNPQTISAATRQSAALQNIVIPGVIENPMALPFGSLIYQHTKHITSQSFENAITDLVWSPNGKRIASSSRNATIQIWDALSGDNLQIITTDQGQNHNFINCLSWSPDGSLLAGGGTSRNASIELWDVYTNNQVASYTNHKKWINDLCWSSDGKWLASASNDRSIQIHDTRTGELEVEYMEPSSWWKPSQRLFKSLSWSLDSIHLACGDDEGNIHILNVETGERIQFYHVHSAAASYVKWSPVGDEIAVCGGFSDANIYICEAMTGQIRRTYQGHRGTYNRVVSLAWSPDGQLIASSGGRPDSRIQVWNARTGVRQQFYSGHDSDINALSWSPDGNYIASGGDEGIIQVWKA
jgi:serine/threonine protein kinase/ribosomal protein L40E